MNGSYQCRTGLEGLNGLHVDHGGLAFDPTLVFQVAVVGLASIHLSKCMSMWREQTLYSGENLSLEDRLHVGTTPHPFIHPSIHPYKCPV